MNPKTHITTEPLQQTTCRRCGTCCLKGGPALHLEDHDLVWEGRIPLGNIFTIRLGEPVYDNIVGSIAPASHDILKIKKAKIHTSACIYYHADKKACKIYTHRPLECRTLACWNPEPLMALYQKDRLSRHDLLSKIEGLAELVEHHQRRCDYHRIAELSACLRDHYKGQNSRIDKDNADASKGVDALNQLIEIVHYDALIRGEVLKRTAVKQDMLEFLLGRPLTLTIRLFRVKVIQNGKAVTIRPM